MKCEKCGNEYSSFYYFATESICKECFNKMPPEEQAQNNLLVYDSPEFVEYGWRVPFGLRLGAVILDLIFLMIIMTLVLLLTGTIQEYKNIFDQILIDPDLMEELTQTVVPYAFIVTFMYYSLEIFMAATFGKIILGIQIADESRKASNYSQLFIRFCCKHFDSILSLAAFLSAIQFIGYVSNITFIALIVGFFFVLNPKRQAFHDMFAKTAIFRRKDVIYDSEK